MEQDYLLSARDDMINGVIRFNETENWNNVAIQIFSDEEFIFYLIRLRLIKSWTSPL